METRKIDDLFWALFLSFLQHMYHALSLFAIFSKYLLQIPAWSLFPALCLSSLFCSSIRASLLLIWNPDPNSLSVLQPPVTFYRGPVPVSNHFQVSSSALASCCTSCSMSLSPAHSTAPIPFLIHLPQPCSTFHSSSLFIFKPGPEPHPLPCPFYMTFLVPYW